MNIEKIQTSLIRENPNNPRSISDEKFEQLKQSIQQFPKMMELRPIVVNDDMVTIGGNMRLRALNELNIQETYIIKASNFTKDELKEFLVKDNLSYGEWDYDMLLQEYNLSTLYEYGLDIPTKAIKLDNNDNFKPDDVDLSDYTIYFESQEERELFYTFLSYLKNKFKGHNAISTRVIHYIQKVYEAENMSESKMLLTFLSGDEELNHE